MIGRQERWQEDLFVAAPLRDLVPDDHILKRVDKVLDLAWLRDEVRGLYDEQQGRPSIDPEAALRLMLAGLFLGITQDRKLMREAQVNLAIRWFAGFRLTDRLPDHSSLTRIRQRWGQEPFTRIFRRTVSMCAAAGLVNGETVHIDATLIRADVSWESLTERHLEQQRQEHAEAEGAAEPPAVDAVASEKPSKKPPKKYSPTDPEATLTTSCKQYRMEPCYKQHTAVDDRAGVIVDVHVTTGESSEGRQLPQQIERIEAQTGTVIKTVTADGAYAHSANYVMLEQRGTQAIIPPQPEATRAGRVPARRFRYDARHDVVRCPKGCTLQRGSATPNGYMYRARSVDCRACVLRPVCVPASASARSIVIVNGYTALLRARRRRHQWGEAERTLYDRHRWRVEGIHGEAKTQHGLRRAARRGLANVSIQANLTAAVMNLKRLAARAPGIAGATPVLTPTTWPPNGIIFGNTKFNPRKWAA